MKTQIQRILAAVVICAAGPVFFPAIAATMTEADIYEADNSYEMANIIILNSDRSQEHNFHEQGDEDWVKFFGLEGETYRITASNKGEGDIVIEFCGTDGLMQKRDDELEGGDESLDTQPLPEDGIYYVRLSDVSEIFEDYAYELTVVQPNAADEAASFEGFSRDAVSGNPLGGTMIRTTQNFTALTEEEDGSFVMYHKPLAEADTFSLEDDSATLSGQVPGYEIFEKLVFAIGNTFKTPDDIETLPPQPRHLNRDTSIPGSSLVEWDGVIEMQSVIAGDISGDRVSDLADLLIALKTAAGTDTQAQIRPDYENSGIDVNGDNKVGTEEAISILRYLSESAG